MDNFPLKFLFGKTFAATQPKPAVRSFSQCSECHQIFLCPSKCNRSLAKTFWANIWYLTKREYEKRIKFPLRVKCASALKRIGMQLKCINNCTFFTAWGTIKLGAYIWNCCKLFLHCWSCTVWPSVSRPQGCSQPETGDPVIDYSELILLENEIFISLISLLIKRNFSPNHDIIQENWTALLFRHFRNKSYNISKSNKVSYVLMKYLRMAPHSCPEWRYL